MDELEALRRKKMAELQARLQEEQTQKEQLAQAEAQIKAVLTQILTPEARARLTNIKMAKPEYATQVELLLIQLAQSGQIKGKITDKQLKALLAKITKPKKDFKIKRV
ncbi:MAG: DNA-binding protein [Candidatus Hydrothermarchaeales archaeon]